MITTVVPGVATPVIIGRREGVLAPFIGLVIVGVVAMHMPAVLPLVEHTGRGATQSVVEVVLHARQTRVVRSQIGVAPEQSALVEHMPVVGTVKLTGMPVGPVVPPSTLAAEAVCIPGERGIVGVYSKLPDPSVIAVPAGIPSMKTCTVELGVPVPRTGGRLPMLVLPFIGLVMLGGVATQRPAVAPVLEQYGVAPLQSGDPAPGGAHPWHMREVASQIGVAPEQSALVVHPVGIPTVKLLGMPVGPTVELGPTFAAATVCIPGVSDMVGAYSKAPMSSVIAVPTGMPSM